MNATSIYKSLLYSTLFEHELQFERPEAINNLKHVHECKVM